MKTLKTSLGIATVVAMSLMSVSTVFAERQSTTLLSMVDSALQVTHTNNEDVSAQVNVQVKDDAENSQNESDDHANIKSTASPTPKENEGNNGGDTNPDSHRSTVSTFVKNLLEVADREGGIGAEVRIIAKEQSDSQEKVSTALEEIKSKGTVSSFLFGADYKNIGVLRSEMVTTSNQIARLQALVEKTTDVTDKATLEVQIKLLQDEQVKIQAFINLYENNFSLFGWFVKMI